MNSVKLQDTKSVLKKSICCFLYVNNELSKREIKETVLLKIVKDYMLKTVKTLMKEIEEVTNKLKDILCSWIRRVNIV